MIEFELNTEKKGKRKLKIPSCNELTVKQYIDFMALEKQDIIGYISICLNVDYKTSWNFSVKNIQLLELRVGSIEDYTKQKPKKYMLGHEVEEISTIGQRVMIEESGKNLEGEDLMLFVLAVALVKEPDIDKVFQLKEKLYNENYLNVLPTAFFLLKNFVNGRTQGKNFLARLIFWIKTKLFGNRLALKS